MPMVDMGYVPLDLGMVSFYHLDRILSFGAGVLLEVQHLLIVLLQHLLVIVFVRVPQNAVFVFG